MALEVRVLVSREHTAACPKVRQAKGGSCPQALPSDDGRERVSGAGLCFQAGSAAEGTSLPVPCVCVCVCMSGRGPAHPPCSVCQAPQPWPLGRRPPAAALAEHGASAAPPAAAPSRPAAPLAASPRLCSWRPHWARPEMMRPKAFRTKHRPPLAGTRPRLGGDSVAWRILQGCSATHWTGCWPARAGIPDKVCAGLGCRAAPPPVTHPVSLSTGIGCPAAAQRWT